MLLIRKHLERGHQVKSTFTYRSPTEYPTLYWVLRKIKFKVHMMVHDRKYDICLTEIRINTHETMSTQPQKSTTLRSVGHRIWFTGTQQQSVQVPGSLLEESEVCSGFRDAQDLYRPNGSGRVPPLPISEACARKEHDHRQRDEKEWGVCDGH